MCVRTTYTIYFADEMKNHKNERESTGRYIIWRWLQWADRVGILLLYIRFISGYFIEMKTINGGNGEGQWYLEILILFPYDREFESPS